MIIENAIIRKIMDSRGNPTVEVDIYTTTGFGRAAAPSGASTGIHEVTAIPKKGVEESIKIFDEKVVPAIIGENALQQKEIDSILHEVDGTDDFSSLGGNTAVATSLAVAKAAANVLEIPLYKYVGGTFVSELPRPMGNIIGGGAHAVGGTTIQEFLVISLGETLLESVFANANVHKLVGQKIKEKLPDCALGVGDERAWVAPLDDVEALEIIHESCKEISKKVGFEIKLAIDFAASGYYENGKYHYKDEDLTVDEQIDFVSELVDRYGVCSLEDPLQEEDFEGFATLTEKVGDKALIIGDDLFVTNKKRLAEGIEKNACNAILIKPNQIGTLTETYETVEMAKKAGYARVISHRSGETTDESIAHLAISFGCKYIKTGTFGGERLAKLNVLIRI